MSEGFAGETISSSSLNSYRAYLMPGTRIIGVELTDLLKRQEQLLIKLRRASSKQELIEAYSQISKLMIERVECAVSKAT